MPNEIYSINGKLACNDASPENPIGAVYTEYHASQGIKRYIYLQADDAFTQYGIGVISESGLKAETVATTTLCQMPIMAMASVTDEYYTWFQFEGLTLGGRAIIGTNVAYSIASGSVCIMSAGTQLIVGYTGAGSNFIGFMIAYDAMTGATLDSGVSVITYSTMRVFLRGEKGCAKSTD